MKKDSPKLLIHHDLSSETQEGLDALVRYSVDSRRLAGASRETIRSKVTAIVLEAARRIGMSPWAEETVIAYVHRLLDDLLVPVALLTPPDEMTSLLPGHSTADQGASFEPSRQAKPSLLERLESPFLRN